MDEQQLRKLCFFKALAKDAVEQNLITDDIFVSHWKIPGKVEFDAIKIFGDGNCLCRYASRTFPILVGNEYLHKKWNEEVKSCGTITIKWRKHESDQH